VWVSLSRNPAHRNIIAVYHAEQLDLYSLSQKILEYHHSSGQKYATGKAGSNVLPSQLRPIGL
jgi:hypothetical protein